MVDRGLSASQQRRPSKHDCGVVLAGGLWVLLGALDGAVVRSTMSLGTRTPPSAPASAWAVLTPPLPTLMRSPLAAAAAPPEMPCGIGNHVADVGLAGWFEHGRSVLRGP